VCFVCRRGVLLKIDSCSFKPERANEKLSGGWLRFLSLNASERGERVSQISLPDSPLPTPSLADSPQSLRLFHCLKLP
jgi:hypothetical protein